MIEFAPVCFPSSACAVHVTPSVVDKLCYAPDVNRFFLFFFQFPMGPSRMSKIPKKKNKQNRTKPPNFQYEIKQFLTTKFCYLNAPPSPLKKKHTHTHTLTTTNKDTTYCLFLPISFAKRQFSTYLLDGLLSSFPCREGNKSVTSIRAGHRIHH